MQSKLIELKRVLSKRVIVFTTAILILSILLCMNFTSLSSIVRLIIVLVITISLSILIYSILVYSLPNIDIIVDKNRIILWVSGKPTIAKLISVRQYTFILTIMSLQVATRKINIPIFISSIPRHKYKALRVFLAWY